MDGCRPRGARFLQLSVLAVAAVTVVVISARARAEQDASPGPLSKAHAALEGPSTCQSCHEPDQRVTAGKCLSCHQPIRDRMARRKGVHRDVTDECAPCHVEHLGLDADLRPIDPPSFDHAGETGFALAGRHVAVATDCARCHKTRSFLQASPECSSCHTDPHQGAMDAPCAACHSPEGWRTPGRAFHKGTVFPLEGRHLAVPCASCHVQGQVKGTPTRCYDCHWVRRQDDLYKTRLGNECEDCHRPTSWTAVTWDHGSRTGMPLNVAHRLLACDSCHKDQVFRGALPACVTCHERDYASALQPSHRAAGFPLDCTVCHSPAAPTFAGARFDHGAFQRVGAHATATCDSCHRNGVYRGTPRDCLGCHQGEYQRTQNPNHAAAGFPTTCDSCHRNTDPSWRDATFNHASAYPLVGAHVTVACSACHRNNVYRGTPRECAGCHLPRYQATTNPNHVASGFPTTCESCHRPTSTTWQGATFTHAASYPLRGAHASATCASCHRNNVYQGTSRECVSCHQADYQRTSAPGHAAAGFPTTCETCHREGGPGWQTQAFTHTAAFPLQGAHSTATCATCHRGGVYRGTSPDCASCHQADYQRAANPNHAAAGFPTTCASCHRSGGPGWSTAGFAHNQYFPLSGTHASTACASCHRNNVFRGTPRECLGCHQADYGATRNPNHAAAGFPTDCASCHRNGGPGWGSTFNHGATFTLLGMHAATQCSSCHTNNVYRGTPRACFPCHQAKYQATTSPAHAPAGFPTTCESCHRNGGPGWTPATFNHGSYYALVGVHATQPCSACHRNNVYRGTPRECAGCHLARYQATRNPNHAAAGFPTTCETCHRATDSSWTQGRFTHTWFPITSGRHANNACSACHQDGGNFRVFTCLTCHTRAETDREHQGRAGYRYDSVACYSCHPQGRAD